MQDRNAEHLETRLDALVVGCGFGGIYASYSLRKLGLNFACVDNAGDVGGTWYWNRYPGAMSDTHSHLYRFSFDEEDYKEYPFSHNYVYQAEILGYLQHVVARHDLRRHMQFNTEMRSAVFDEKLNIWRVTMSTGQIFVVRYLISAMGLLSQPIYPDIPGLHDFKGTIVHTATWQEDLDLRGKRVALIGTGSTGVQITTSIAPHVSSLTCFVRHPQYVVPAGYREFEAEKRRDINTHFSEFWDKVRKSVVAFGFQESTRSFASATPEERETVFEELWAEGNGFWFMLGGFNDLTTNLEANEFAADFVRRKIRMIVQDPDKARILSPYDHYARRPICGNFYYEQFSRDNVHLVDVKEDPITAVTSRGITTSDDIEREFDVIILATGFDALDGNYTRLHIVGRCGESIQEHWSEAITSYCGVMLSGFPNMFMILGPQSPFANNPPVIESQVDLIIAAIQRSEALRSNSGHAGVVEVTPEAESSWARRCEDVAEGSLFKKTSSWIFGGNVPGKVFATRFFFPGLGPFREFVESSIWQDWQGISFL
ncbi:uncharacterized protein A1O9_00003 [Exophiala aquamarina CBS 119918]|uniref:Cyclohexanone monooxygenase n=1 Tax=Exophiala aquamarina CBS 119918 TaxID=1182545 RepID=A0A072PQ76_9EURO|nr:uncharacterized protein A1O9_00003 [Exophiala aquamarina CBS 119918]KEF62031.1 hypothetical protein A1O9_00003 [Exophiala aquamarina CBS 119918]